MLRKKGKLVRVGWEEGLETIVGSARSTELRGDRS